MLIPHESLCHMKGIIDFEACNLQIPNIGKFDLIKTESGHLMIQWGRPSQETIRALKHKGRATYFAEMKIPVKISPNEDIVKIHVQLGHCSENTLISTIRAAQMHCELPVIQAVLVKCGCQTAVQRITLPVVASTLAKYNGGIIALDVIFPLANFFWRKNF